MAQEGKSTADKGTANEAIDKAVAEGGAYAIIRKRLEEQGKQLSDATVQLNQDRLNEFGNTEMAVSGRARIRTENNCVARDIVQIGDSLLFGYNVFIGLKKETKVADVFAIYRLEKQDGGLELTAQPYTDTFLTQRRFVDDFEELYRYYKHTKLVQLVAKNGKLLAAFQIGERLEDNRVFRWALNTDGSVGEYIDNRGERDIQLPSPYDFEWTETRREDTVQGRHPHINILDKVFVETLNGHLTIKIENNTEDGLGIYQEPVEDKTQSLDDAEIAFAELGSLVLLRIKPYREEVTRYLVFNSLTESVTRIDALGESCVQLPEDHGIIFPGGYYLQSGEHKRFDDTIAGLTFKRMFRSPNGEDVLYIFYQPEGGQVALLAYNLIEKQLRNPVTGHGYALAANGELVMFSAENEATRVHPVQIWATPFESAEHASKAPPSQTFLGRIGNAELVRGVSDLFSITRLIDNQSASAKVYETLGKAARKVFDDHYWLAEGECEELAKIINAIAKTADQVLDEFEKVESIRRQSAKALNEAEATQDKILLDTRPENYDSAEQFIDALAVVKRQRGHLMTLAGLRYIDTERIGELAEKMAQREGQLSEKTLHFLSDEAAFDPYLEKIEAIDKDVEKIETKVELTEPLEAVQGIADNLDMLSELMTQLKIPDATLRTQIVDSIAKVYAKLNQTKAKANIKAKDLGSAEASAQFSAQFNLLSQSITNALGVADEPDKCDEQMAQLLMRLEELESQFGEYDEFLTPIMDKRDEIYNAFEARKQQLVDERNRQAQKLSDAAARMLASIEKRSLQFSEADDLNTYFASDTLVQKIRELVVSLRELDSPVKADDIEARFKGIKDQAVRGLRDKSDIFEAGGSVIKLGPRHRFSVNRQELDLSIIPREGQLQIHLTGTDYFEPIDNPKLRELRPYWEQALVSENAKVYRGEYLAYSVWRESQSDQGAISAKQLDSALAKPEDLAKLVRDYASPRYQEGYEKGVHDHDAVVILSALCPALAQADLLVYEPRARALAQLFWRELLSFKKAWEKISIIGGEAEGEPAPKRLKALKTWQARAQSAQQLLDNFASRQAKALLVKELEEYLKSFVQAEAIAVTEATTAVAADYLFAELALDQVAFVKSQYCEALIEAFKRALSESDWQRFQAALEKLKGQPGKQWDLAEAWLLGYFNSASATEQENQKLKHYVPEALVHLLPGMPLPYRDNNANLELTVSGLLGEHPNISKQQLHFGVDAFLQRLQQHWEVDVPNFHHYHDLRQAIASETKAELRLQEFKPRPLSAFVRNRLINDSYLPLIGDNLAKQMGTVGDNKRSDLMGLLMMISPPGYGKTTLMEYVASRLGLIFMKINCPSLGHDVVSLDPAQAPNATAVQELNKLNLAFEMSNNVMLYLDDIQHTHPEFLQKFISLCDGTRRIEGVWQGKTKTYDMRGKKFCVIMAGNPYTESGETFKVPDMLANRADIYNLGDILGGMDEQFASSYIENALTSNAVLAPLAVRDMADVYRFMDLARGKNIASSEFSHEYSGAEISEVTAVLKKMFRIQEVVLAVNKQYIASAAQADKYRTEPPFKLQGSYRNMNKMSEKISAVMNDEELAQMIDDHYLGEAQLLTSGAEDNLLKLAELRGQLSTAQTARWQQIKSDFLRNKAMGGDDSDTGAKVVAQLVDLVSTVQNFERIAETAGQRQTKAVVLAKRNTKMIGQELSNQIAKIGAVLAEKPAQVEVFAEPVPGLNGILETLAHSIEQSLVPVVRSMDKKLDIDLRTHHKLVDIANELRDIQNRLPSKASVVGRASRGSSGEEKDHD